MILPAGVGRPFWWCTTCQKHPCQPPSLLCVTNLPIDSSTRQSIPWWCKVGISGVMILPADVGQAFLVMPTHPKAPLPACPHASFTILPTNNSPRQSTTLVQLHP